MIPSSSCLPRQPDQTGQTRRRAQTHCRSYTTPWGTITASLGRLRSILYRAEIGSSGWIPVIRRRPLGRQGCADCGPSCPHPCTRRFDLLRTFGSAFEIETPIPPGASRMRQLRRDMPQRLTQSWRVGKFDDDCGLGQPPTANSSFSRITLSGSSRGNSGSWSGVIAWRNSLISVRQSSSVRSRGHSAESGSQQVIGSIPSSFPLCGGLTRKHNTVVLAAGSSIKPEAIALPQSSERGTPRARRLPPLC